MTRKYSPPQKRGELFDKLLTFFRSEEKQFLRIEMPRACKSYPYVAMDRSGVKAKAVYYTLSTEPNPLDDILCWTITKNKHETKQPKAATKSKAKTQPEKTRKRAKKIPETPVPIVPTKGVDITQVALTNV